jgi:hypothetical protein
MSAKTYFTLEEKDGEYKKCNYTKFLWGNFLENRHLKDQELG